MNLKGEGGKNCCFCFRPYSLFLSIIASAMPKMATAIRMLSLPLQQSWFGLQVANKSEVCIGEADSSAPLFSYNLIHSALYMLCILYYSCI
jgi:hypothetical protein